jgi:hypothetical protein
MSPFPHAPEGFSAETLELLDQVFSATWRDFQRTMSPAVSPGNEQATLTAIAKSIVDLAETGVREPERLKRHALHAAEQAKPRRRTIVHLPD